MLTTKAEIKLTKNGKEHRYIVDNDATLEDCFEMLSTIRLYFYGRIKDIQDQQKAPSDVEPKPES